MTALRPLVVLALFGAGALSAHFVWVDAAPAKLEVGKTVKVRVGNGHDIAASESALKFDGGQAFAVAPSGKRTELKPVVEGNWLVAPYKVEEPGLHRFQIVQDRGPISRVGEAYVPGDRKAHPTAERSLYSWRTATAYARTGAERFALGKPLGLPLELLAESGTSGLVFTVLRDGKPAAGIEVGIARPGDAQPDPIGKPDAAGKLSYTPPPAVKGPVLFVAAVVDPAPKGANCDTRNLTAVVDLNW